MPIVSAGNRMWNDIVNANWMRANSNAVNPNMDLPSPLCWAKSNTADGAHGWPEHACKVGACAGESRQVINRGITK
jgi:hypothetical protein